MGQRAALTRAEKEHIYQEKLKGRTLPAIAAEMTIAVETARKWWRVARDQGRDGLQARRRGREPSGVGSHFEPQVIEAAVGLKQAHPGWGPNRVLVELNQRPELKDLALPSRSRMTVVFKSRCAQHVQGRRARPFSPSAAARSGGACGLATRRAGRDTPSG